MSYKFGFEGVLARNTGTIGTPVWDEVPNVDDLELDIEEDEDDVSNRGSEGWEVILPGLHKATIDFGMIYDPDDLDYQAFRDAQIDRDPVEIAVADGPIATEGTQYLRLHTFITKSGRKEELRKGMRVPIKLRPGFVTGANAPAWVIAE